MRGSSARYPTEKSWIIISEGVLNDLSPAEEKKIDHGVILIGGPSKHHCWNDDTLVQQVRDVIAHSPTIEFQLSPSRRTPKATADRLRNLAGVEYVELEGLDESWLPRILSEAALVWVSADSVSMIYEALSCGANVGLLEVPIKRRDRITRIADDLVSRGMVTRFATWKQTQAMPNSPLLQESDRIARLVNNRLLRKTGAP
ncbi:MAG: ELM1/GtrOC1 family putative glycosyltransferase [Gammaproteobacteria bacterium]